MREHTDRAPTDKRQDIDSTILSVAETAARLGVTPDAIRARLHRGTLAGAKVEGAWQVFFPATDDPTHQPDDRPDATGTQQASDTMPAGAAALVEALRDEVAFLRRQVEHAQADHAERERRHAAELERRDVLHREALERIPRQPAQLTAGTSHEDARQTPPEGTGATQLTQPADAASSSPRRPWWRRALGLP